MIMTYEYLYNIGEAIIEKIVKICEREGYGSSMKAFALNETRRKDEIRTSVAQIIQYYGYYRKPKYFIGKGKDGKTYKVGIWE